MNTEQVVNKFILSGTLDMGNINSINLFKTASMIPFKSTGNNEKPFCM